MNFAKNFLLTIFIGLIVILLTAGLGCKQPTATNSATNTQTPVAQPVATPTNTETTKTETTTPTTTQPTETTTPTATSTEDEQTIVVKLAEKIAEIFGTYSTRDTTPYQNLKDLKTYGTDQLNSWLDGMIKAQASSGPFHGWATKAISSAVLESSSDSIKILVTCKKEEFLEDQKTPKVSYQMLTIDFKKVGEEWKVDKVVWL